MSEIDTDKSGQGGVSDRDLAILERQLGLDEASTIREFHSTISTDAIRNYAESIGDNNPLYLDENYAKGTRWGKSVAPQIMMAITNAPLLGNRIPDDIRSPTTGMFQGCWPFVSGGTWTWYRPIYAGDTLYSFEGEESIEVKPSKFGGKTLHSYRRYVKFNQRGEIVGIYRRLVIVAEKSAAKKNKKYTELEPASYTEDEIQAIDQHYLNERCAGADSQAWDDVEIGDALPVLKKGPLTTTDIILVHCAGYGWSPNRMLATGRLAALDRKEKPQRYPRNKQGAPDTNARVHWEQDLAESVGNPLPYDWGVQREFWLHHAITDWMGDDGFVIKQRDEIRGFNYIGDLQTFSGEVIRKYQEDGMNLVDIKVEATNQRGTRTALAEATVSLPSKDGSLSAFPEPPKDLQRAALDYLARHNQLRQKKV